MKYMNKTEYNQLVEANNEKFGAYDLVEFKVNVFTSEYGVPGEKKEVHTFRNGDKLKDEKGEDLFVGYDEFNDGSPRWIAYKENELASPDYKVVGKRDVAEEAVAASKKEEEMRLQKEEKARENQKKWEEQEVKREIREAALKEEKKYERKNEMLEFLQEKGYMAETAIAEDGESIKVKMFDKENNTLATIESKLVNSKDVNEDFGVEIPTLFDDEGVEYAYPKIFDTDSMVVKNGKGKEIEDTGSVYMVVSALESLAIWENDMSELVSSKDAYNIDIEEKDPYLLFEPLKTQYENKHVVAFAQKKTERAALDQVEEKTKNRSRNRP